MSFAARAVGHTNVGSIVVPLVIGDAISVSEGGVASASITISSNGTHTSSGSDTSSSGNWFSPTTSNIGSSYWVKATLVSGTTPSGSVGVWVSLAGGQSWGVGRGSIGSTTANMLFQIASDSSGTNIVSSDNATIRATVVFGG